MPAGRPSKPNELKSLQGTDRKDRKSESLEVIKFEDITQLKVLKVKGLESALSRKIFDEKANMLILNKMLAPQDIDQLIIYANAMAMVITCSKEIKGKVFTETYDKDGGFNGYIQNPHLKLFKEMSEIVTKIGAEFGFTPLSRMKFKLTPEEKKDPFQELFDKFNNQP